LAGASVDRDSGPTAAGHGVQLAIHVQRGCPKYVVRPRTEVVTAPDPCGLQLREVRSVDLIEWRVARAPGVSSPVSPFARGIAAFLRSYRSRGERDEPQSEHERSDSETHWIVRSHCSRRSVVKLGPVKAARPRIPPRVRAAGLNTCSLASPPTVLDLRVYVSRGRTTTPSASSCDRAGSHGCRRPRSGAC